jgi:hypothetical protein
MVEIILSTATRLVNLNDKLLNALRSTEEAEVIWFVERYRFNHELDVNETEKTVEPSSC